jgi:hypothetical protein
VVTKTISISISPRCTSVSYPVSYLDVSAINSNYNPDVSATNSNYNPQNRLPLH